MKNIFVLTKREQRVVILIVMALLAAALAKHSWQNRAHGPRQTSTPTETAQPTPHPNEEQTVPED